MSGHPLTEVYRKAAIVVAHTYRPRLLYEGSWVDHTVAWYRTEARGHRDYLERKDPVFSKWEPWEELSAWAYTSPYADEQNLVCIQENVSGTIVGYQCFFIARYGQHLSVLNIRLVAKRANPDQVKEWIVTVDELFADLE